MEITEESVGGKLIPNIPSVHCWYIEGFDTKQDDSDTTRTDDNREMLIWIDIDRYIIMLQQEV